MTPGFRLSVAAPVYNEERLIPELISRIGAVLDGIAGGPHQIVLVDDGSWDRTLQVLEEAVQTDPRLTVVSLSRNFGHQAALTAALEYTTGDAVVLMDGDLQDEPEIIPAFVERFREGYDVVYATRAGRREGWALKLSYYLFYRLQGALSDTRLPLDAGDFGLMSRRVVDQLRRLPEHHRFLRGLRSWVGFRQVSIPVQRAARHSGKSKYSLVRLLKLASDGIFAFSTLPLRIATLLGGLTVMVSGLFAVYAVYVRLMLNRSPEGFTALVLLITFLAGMLLFFLGIIGEYLGRVYEELKARPIYIVNRVTQHDLTNTRGANAPGEARVGSE